MPIDAGIYYHAYLDGERLPVVLIHGAGGNHLYWPAEIRRLSGYRVYALDLPGHGKSHGRGQQSIAAYSQAVLEWMEAVNMHRAVFVGHSMGGAIAQKLALDHGQHVLALGLVSSAARLRVNPELLEDTLSPTTFQRAVDRVVEWSFGPQTPERLVELARERTLEVRPSVLHNDLLACEAFDVTGRVSEIRRPTLVISGSEDRMVPLRYAQFLADQIPRAHMVTVPGAGHMVMLEQPEDVEQALDEFLAGIYF